MDKLQKLKGCTHINGSLVIRLAGVDINTENTIVEDFDEYLGSVKYIRDTLIVARTNSIKSLSFLKNLRLIKGENLENQKYAIFFFENQNLQKLWDFEDKNFTLKIERGDIAFHNNPQLCTSEIIKLANLTNRSNFTTLDVFSNGDKSLCDFVNFHVNVSVNVTNATLTWKPAPLAGNDTYIGFTVYYIEHAQGEISIYESKDVCDGKGWKSQFTVNNGTLLSNLMPYTRYAYYVKIYRRLMGGGQSNVSYFQTLPDDPEVPSYFSVTSIDYQTIKLKWKPPRSTNGILGFYKYDVDVEPDMQVHLERDYCLHPMTLEGEKSDEELEESEISQRTLNRTLQISDSCSCSDASSGPKTEEVSFFVWDDYLPLCDVHSQSKFGFDKCKHLLYKPIDSVKESEKVFYIDKRTSNHNSVKKARPYSFTNNTIDPNLSEYKVKNLKHFTLYIIYFSACNVGNKCGPVLQTFVRTKKRDSADDIESVETKVENTNVVITWSEPKNPNSVIVSYNIEYKKIDLEHFKPTTECLARNENFKGNYLRLNLSPGKYSVHVQAVSLAGSGRFSRPTVFIIAAPAKDSAWVVPVISMGAQEHDLYGQYNVSDEEVSLYVGDSSRSRPRFLPSSLSQRLSRFSPSDLY
ncbi:hypothetical protein NQ314_021476 [Rhamnusium bicolor]|uniref:Fibronectin type-III domain-containing protein n=1 Tax=Rhamnusium bicolor TaxID=1586634 RepID=A0AAV8WI80_9CUCU|nr:hypothetical protein NQ314_021476 [Rhamnusium bicolor]